ncbi:MAG: rhomboid family intramembrane serine protease [Actinomycetota bacterium]
MIPFADETPRRPFPWVTVVLVALCTIVFFTVQPTKITTDHILSPDLELVNEDDLQFLVDNAAIPCEIVKGRPLTELEYRRTFGTDDDSACGDRGGDPHSPGKIVYLALLTSMFLHGSPAHLFGNLLFLWVFGNDIEFRWGRRRYLLLYLLGGVVAGLAHVLADPDSTIPMIGASGAIAAVMGAYLVCYPANRVKTIIFLGVVLLRKVKAVWLLLVWLAMQLLLIGDNSGVAWAAHVGGFAFGALVGLIWRRRPGVSPPPPVPAADARRPALPAV